MGNVVQIICLLFISIAILSVSSSTVQHPKKEVQKPKLILEYNWPEPKKNLKRFPHPESCFHFYLTKPDGSHAIKKCHGGEIFDYRSLRCMEKSSAKCWKDIVNKGNLKKAKKHFSCPFPWGLYPVIEDCSQFYDCLGGKAYRRKCPASTLFDKAGRICIDRNEAMCADQSDVIEPGYRCPYKWGFYTHPKDCSKYYECLRKIPSIRSCKKNMLFDNFKRQCLPMKEVKCGRRLNPYEKTSKPSNKEVKTVNASTTPKSVTSENLLDTSDKHVQEITFLSSETTPQETTRTETNTSKLLITPLKGSEVAQELNPGKAENISQQTMPAESDKVTKETTPTTLKLDQGNITRFDEVEQETTVTTVKISPENTLNPSNKTSQKENPASSDKVTTEKIISTSTLSKIVLATMPTKLDKTVAENTSASNSSQEDIPTSNTTSQEDIPTSNTTSQGDIPTSNKTSQGDIPTSNKTSQENIPATSGGSEGNTTATGNRISRKNSPKSPDKVALESTPALENKQAESKEPAQKNSATETDKLVPGDSPSQSKKIMLEHIPAGH